MSPESLVTLQQIAHRVGLSVAAVPMALRAEHIDHVAEMLDDPWANNRDESLNLR